MCTFLPPKIISIFFSLPATTASGQALTSQNKNMFTFTSLRSDAKRQQNGLPISPKTECLSHEVYQSLLSFPPDINILIDVGWDASLSTSLDHLIKLAPTIDLLLLTHATLSHIGAYAFLCKVSPEFAAIPTYSTLPVINMGRMVTLDYYRSKGLLGPFANEQITLEDVENAFDSILPLKYSQSTNLQDRLDGFTITPYNAGHSLGGTLWRIQHDQESVLYAVDWNHSRDSHLNGAFLQSDGKILDALSRPTVMICGSKISDQPGTLRKRKEALFNDIQDTIQAGGSILIPTSSGARVLELCHILDSYWEESRISTPLIYYSHVGFRTMSYASSMLEWMSSSVIEEWEIHNNSPFDTKHLRVYSSIEELAKIDGPKVILASGEALETGFARTLFTKLCSATNSLIVLTERSGGPDSLNGQLYSQWINQREGRNDDTITKSYQLTTQILVDYDVEVPLAGEELADYGDMIREEKHKKELQNAIELRNKNILEEDEENESSDDDDDDEMVLSGQMDTGILIYGQGVYDYDVRTPLGQATGKPKMFPFVAKRRRIDDYGETIKADMFSTKAKEKEDLTGAATVSTNEVSVNMDEPHDARVGEKRQWGSSVSTSGIDLRTNKRNGGGGAGGSNGGDNNGNNNLVGNGDTDESSRLDSFSVLAVPKKMVPEHAEFKVLCSVDFIDFEGLTDDRSIKMIVPLVQPKQLIFLPSILDLKPSSNEVGSKALVSLNNSDTEQQPSAYVDTVVNFFTAHEPAIEKVYKAVPNQAIQAQIGSNIYKVTVSSELEKLLKWQKIVGNYSVAHVTGKLVSVEVPDSNTSQENSDDNNNALVKQIKEEQQDSEPALTVTTTTKRRQELKLVPLETARELAAAPRTNPLMVGDVKLAELKHRLVKQYGLRAEFGAEGILVISNKVAVRKLGEGNIVIEGTGLDEEFYIVKGLVRSMLALV